MRKTLNDGYCFDCGSTYQLTPHESHYGRNRQLSIKYGMVICLCFKCHRFLHDNPDSELHQRVQEKGKEHFETNYPHLDFIEVFK